ncbi:MAG TPA: hypothetical protein DIU48_12870, partial [Acidobacteria bacterium]|nr:hypothetical protein [Acidobacteriota bacterium]
MRNGINRRLTTALTWSFVFVCLCDAAAQDSRLVTAAANQDRATVETLVAEGIDVNVARADGATALLWATHWDDLETVDLLLKAGADPNAADDHGVTPLERAAENASLGMVERLLADGASADKAQDSGLTPLMTAARTGNVDVVRALIDSGAPVNAATAETNSTALMWALSAPHPSIVRLLLEQGADATIETTPGFTPLMFAARNGDIAMAETLLATGIDVNTRSKDGTHVLPFAIAAGRTDFALFLLERGADPNSWMGGVSALHAAAGGVSTWLEEWTRNHGRIGGGRLNPRGRLTLVEALLASGADPNARITSSAMLMFYIGYPKKGAFETFAPGTGDLRGATPLWVAAFEMNGAPSLIYSVIPSFQNS